MVFILNWRTGNFFRQFWDLMTISVCALRCFLVLPGFHRHEKFQAAAGAGITMPQPQQTGTRGSCWGHPQPSGIPATFPPFLLHFISPTTTFFLSLFIPCCLCLLSLASDSCLAPVMTTQKTKCLALVAGFQ